MRAYSYACEELLAPSPLNNIRVVQDDAVSVIDVASGDVALRAAFPRRKDAAKFCFICNKDCLF